MCSRREDVEPREDEEEPDEDEEVGDMTSSLIVFAVWLEFGWLASLAAAEAAFSAV